RRRRRGRLGRGGGRGDDGDGLDATDKPQGSDKQGVDQAQDGASAQDDGSETGKADRPADERDADEHEDGDRSPGEEPAADASGSDSADEAESTADGDDDDSVEDVTDGSSRRRRRRRRRRSGGEGDADASTPDDPPNTVVHEREPRPKTRRDEVRGISGSTRLEAKRQRRRDGRESVRRRPPILTESEFLARREAVDRVMVVRERTSVVGTVDGEGKPIDHPIDYTQVAVLEDGVLVEHFVTSSGSASMVGNIYLGRVQNVLPSMEAAFVDIGRGRNGVLYAGEVNWDAAGLDGNARKIEQALKPGDQVLVQVSKDPVGHKGARLTTQISLAGRFLVYVPGGGSAGISRKLPDTERKRLKDILKDIVPGDAGVIIRTASEGVSAEELARDVERLQQQWGEIESASKDRHAGVRALYEEPDLLVKVVRDLFNEDFSKLVVEGDRSWDIVERYVSTVAPDLLQRVERFEKAHADAPDVFVVHRIDEQLAKALDRKVWLPSGGTLVIDRTEAMTVIDVNTGKFTGAGGNLEETVTRNNLEAAEEIVRQMRLRDIGGMIVVDFIDMVLESNRDLVLRRLTESLGRDRTRHQVSEVTSLGLVQMTRKRIGTGLVEAFSTTCPTCGGRGILIHDDPVDVGGPEDGRQSAQFDGGRNKKRKRSGKPDVVAPREEKPQQSQPHKPHPMFQAMAAAHDSTDDDRTADDGEGQRAAEQQASERSEQRAQRAQERSERRAQQRERRAQE
ncbi:Rne/Rng family ribonuclease, partial [Tsukamurella soli]|uniref:Rne/Rng family ribonuclease n=1 Tax=Tsukamurella soli TaxID=644556 RepID=UPI0031F19012